MTSITFFFFLIPILAIVLLAVNFIFATHTPYQEKNSAFECGFHSFLGQNRMQFNISFYIFGLLFLLFDLEILLIYPYPTSAYFNSLYGLCIMLIFFLVLTLGFAFELGKNALKIDSRQYDDNDTVYQSNKTDALKSSIINGNLFKWLIFIILSYLYIRYCMNIAFCMGPEEEPVDQEYIQNQIFTIQEMIRENGLRESNLSSEQAEIKKECMQALKDNFQMLKELKETESSKELMDSIKRTAETISDSAEDPSAKIQKK